MDAISFKGLRLEVKNLWIKKDKMSEGQKGKILEKWKKKVKG